MKNQKKKKIIYEAVAIMFVVLFLTTNIQAEQELKQISNEKNPNDTKLLSIFGIGLIKYISINDETHKTGMFYGDLSVKNEKGENIVSPYLLFIKDIDSNTMYTKKTLPQELTLINFTGIGHIDYTYIPRGGPKYTAFCLIGEAEYLI
jgi:hypothetical protein